MRYIVLFFLFLTTAFSSFGQDNIEMADTLRSSGKIYIVVGVVLIIFAGIVIYLVSLDRKLGKIEKGLKEKQ